MDLLQIKMKVNFILCFVVFSLRHHSALDVYSLHVVRVHVTVDEAVTAGATAHVQ